jgi:Flp pilus assembly protein TadG
MSRRFTIFRRGKRDGQRGAAALEFALATFVLVPLMLGMIDFGYYFYIGLNTIEAQHAGLIRARAIGVSDCSNTASSAQQSLASTGASNGASEVTTYFSNNGLSSVVSYVSGSNTPTCANNPATWTMSLIVDFRPLLGVVMPWDKPGATGYVRFTAKPLTMR